MVRFLFAAALLLPQIVFAQGLNAGFVQGLWYSKTPFFAGDTVRIYTAIQNNSGFDIQGTVEFVVDGASVGQASFSAVEGRVVEAWTDWQVSKGDHAIGARITEAFKLEIGKEPTPISLGAAELGASQIFVDEDTDQDGVGNAEDPDDDNDGLEDLKEEELGTDPLVPDTDQDGLSDGKEVSQGTDPLLAGLPQESGKEERQEEKRVQETSLAQQVVKTAEQEIDRAIEGVVQNLKEQRAKLAAKQIQAGDSLAQDQKNPDAVAGRQANASSAELSPQEHALDALLAAAIFALPQWRAAFLLFSLLLVLIWIRRSSKREY